MEGGGTIEDHENLHASLLQKPVAIGNFQILHEAFFACPCSSMLVIQI